MSASILIQLRTNLDFLTGAEKKIANVILSNPQRFTTYSLDELSELAGVSHGSIINFSRKFANGGFPALKLSVASSLHIDDVPISTTDICATPKEVLERNITSCTRAFELTSGLNPADTLQRVADRILRAKKVEIYGVSRSAVVATDLYYQLLPLGISASFVSDILACAVSASMLDPGELVIAVSSSGKTGEIVKTVKNAKAHGVPVVCLTSNINSPLARLSDDVLLVAPNDTSISGRSTEIRLSQMLLAGTLCAYILSKMDESGRKRYIELTSVLKTYNVDD